MRLVERRAMPPFGHFSLIRFAKDGGTRRAGQDISAMRAASSSLRGPAASCPL
jgi:hypothetical protein